MLTNRVGPQAAKRSLPGAPGASLNPQVVLTTAYVVHEGGRYRDGRRSNLSNKIWTTAKLSNCVFRYRFERIVQSYQLSSSNQNPLPHVFGFEFPAHALIRCQFCVDFGHKTLPCSGLCARLPSSYHGSCLYFIEGCPPSPILSG